MSRKRLVFLCLFSSLLTIWGVLFYRNAISASFFAFGSPEDHIRRLTLIRWGYLLAGAPLVGIWCHSLIAILRGFLRARYYRKQPSGEVARWRNW